VLLLTFEIGLGLCAVLPSCILKWARTCLLLCGVFARRGVLNIVHGTHDTVNRILDHPDIAAVSFVGGDKAGRYIYERAATNGKRVQVGVPCGTLHCTWGTVC
jgi:acyl-CoA reductase-like NAD-dependent aldehyde dehydrogenase